MAVFRYEALDGSGREVKDTVEAQNKREAIGKIRDLGLFPTKVMLISGEEEDSGEDRVSEVKGSGVVILCDRCKLKRGIETMRGAVGISGSKGEMKLSFRPDPNDLSAGGEISIPFEDIIEVRMKGLLRRSLVVMTKRDGELTFKGNVWRLGIILKMEIKNDLRE